MKFMKDAYQANIKYVLLFGLIRFYVCNLYKTSFDVPKDRTGRLFFSLQYFYFFYLKNIAIFYALCLFGEF